MVNARHNFGLVDSIRPEALGVPGKRIFRLLIDASPPAAATLWLEKEQLYGIAMALKKVLEEHPVAEEEIGDTSMQGPESLLGSSQDMLEFKVGRLGLALGPGLEHITLFFHDEQNEPEEEEEDEEENGNESLEEGSETIPELQFSLTRDRSEEFIQQSLETCASGRGVDALSRNALVAAGKVDPNSNGHFRH